MLPTCGAGDAGGWRGSGVALVTLPIVASAIRRRGSLLLHPILAAQLPGPQTLNFQRLFKLAQESLRALSGGGVLLRAVRFHTLALAHHQLLHASQMALRRL